MSFGGRSYKPLHGVLGEKMVLLAVNFTIPTTNTDSPTLTSDQKKLGLASVTRTGAGAWTVTLDQQYKSIMHACGNVWSAASADWTVHFTGEGAIASKTVKVYAKSAGTNTDPTAAAKVSLFLVLGLSDVGDNTVDTA